MHQDGLDAAAISGARGFSQFTEPRSLVAVLNCETYSEKLESFLLDGLKLFPIDLRGKSVLLKPTLWRTFPAPSIRIRS
jgi:hypothetical protein